MPHMGVCAGGRARIRLLSRLRAIVTAARRVVPIGGREPCPHGRKPHGAVYAVRTGNVRGVTCADHIPAALRDHTRALRIVARMT